MQKGSAHFVIVLIIFAAIMVSAVGILVWRQQLHLPLSNVQKACTQEAKICPDGSGVGRTGPNCEFATCPNTEASPSGLLPMKTQNNETLTPEEQKKILPMTDIANWKTYTSKKYHFSIMYPPDWVASDEASFDESYPPPIGLLKLNPSSDQTQHRPYVEVYFDNRAGYVSPDDYIRKSNGNFTAYNVILVPDSLKALKVEEVEGLPGGGAPGPELVIQTREGIMGIHTEMVRVIVGTDLNSAQNQQNMSTREKLYNQIFATFKLI